MSALNPLRSVGAVFVGIALFALMDNILEFSIVHVLAHGPVNDLNAYFAVRNQPLGLAAKLTYTPFIAILAGYTTAKIAGRHEIAHTAGAAALLVSELGYGFTKGPFASMTPVWMRAALLVLTPAAIALGGFVRARAAQLERSAPTDRKEEP